VDLHEICDILWSSGACLCVRVCVCVCVFSCPARQTCWFLEIVQMLRILFLYAKLNPGVKYVQGMNEILAPLYYLFCHDTSIKSNGQLDTSFYFFFFFKKKILFIEARFDCFVLTEDAEADAFWCFTSVMSEIRDHFIAVLDRSDAGINHKLQEMYDLLRDKDPHLYQHLVRPN
jgi:hypothetical protein